MMRVRGDIDQKALAELIYRYVNVEEDFAKALFAKGQTQLGRAFVDETRIPLLPKLEVMDDERASEVIRSATHIGLSLCYCRRKMSHLARACDAPQDICLTFNQAVCLGYAVCARICQAGALTMQSRPQRIVTPLNTAHRVVLMAIERGTLVHVVLNNRVMENYQALAAFLGVLFKLPPFKQILANKQLQSRYLETIIQRLKWQPSNPPRSAGNS